jgi:hypothetical protein
VCCVVLGPALASVVVPYREPVALARYPIRASRGYSVALMAAAALTVGGPLWLLGGMATPVVAILPGLLLAALPGLIVLAVYGFSAEAHSVAGGQGDIVLHASRIVVPPPWGSEPLSFAISGIEIGFAEIRSSINFIPVSEVEILTISGGGKHRRLSSRLFDDRGALRRLARDIERLQAGELPTGPAPDVVVPAPRDDVDDVIDHELDEL